MDLKRGAIADIIINSLYKYTPLETSFGINMMAVVGKRPMLLNLKEVLRHFLEHRREVIIRRTKFDLDKCEKRVHILEGLRIALDNIDEVVKLIRASKTPEEARDGLMERFSLSEIQAKAILDMRLQKLTGLEHDKLLEELAELMKKIEYFTSILENEEVLKGVIREELMEIKENYSTPRRSELLMDDPDSIDIEDLIPDEETVITLSRRGYIKRTPLSNYTAQRRGGKGISGVQTSDGDFIHTFMLTTNHQHLVLFTNLGKMFKIKVHQVPEGSRYAKGGHVNNLLPLEKDENIATALSLREFQDDRFFLFVTKKGMIKRSSMGLYGNCRSTGIRAVNLRDNDELMTVREIDPNVDCILASREGSAIRFDINDARPLGRATAGVKGMALRPNDEVVACVVTGDTERDQLLTVSEGGFGKRTTIDQYRVQSRGGKGILNMRLTNKTGKVIGARMVNESDDVILLTSQNKVIRMSVGEVSQTRGRATQGVRLVRMDKGNKVAGFDLVMDDDEELKDETL